MAPMPLVPCFWIKNSPTKIPQVKGRIQDPRPGAATFNPEGRLTGASSITLVGNYAYLTTGSALAIYDVSNPLAPQLRGSVTIPNGFPLRSTTTQPTW